MLQFNRTNQISRELQNRSHEKRIEYEKTQDSYSAAGLTGNTADT